MTADAGETPGTEGANASGETPSESAGEHNEAESVDGLKSALTRERSDRKALDKEARDLRARLAEFEDRDKSELEKIAARAEAAERELTGLKRRDLARTVATEAGIPDLWEYLPGDDEDAMRKKAKELAEKLGAGSGTGGTPAADLGAGTRGESGRAGSAGFSEQLRRQMTRR